MKLVCSWYARAFLESYLFWAHKLKVYVKKVQDNAQTVPETLNLYILFLEFVTIA